MHAGGWLWSERVSIYGTRGSTIALSFAQAMILDKAVIHLILHRCIKIDLFSHVG